MNVEEKQIMLGGKTYNFADFSEKQQYILKQLDFIQKEEEGLKMAIDRCMAVKKTFLDEWKKTTEEGASVIKQST